MHGCYAGGGQRCNSLGLRREGTRIKVHNDRVCWSMRLWRRRRKTNLRGETRRHVRGITCFVLAAVLLSSAVSEGWRIPQNIRARHAQEVFCDGDTWRAHVHFQLLFFLRCHAFAYFAYFAVFSASRTERFEALTATVIAISLRTYLRRFSFMLLESACHRYLLHVWFRSRMSWAFVLS